jgi:hypothetical protein
MSCNKAPLSRYAPRIAFHLRRLLTKDEARRIAVNFAKLLSLSAANPHRADRAYRFSNRSPARLEVGSISFISLASVENSGPSFFTNSSACSDIQPQHNFTSRVTKAGQPQDNEENLRPALAMTGGNLIMAENIVPTTSSII